MPSNCSLEKFIAWPVAFLARKRCNLSLAAMSCWLKCVAVTSLTWIMILDWRDALTQQPQGVIVRSSGLQATSHPGSLPRTRWEAAGIDRSDIGGPPAQVTVPWEYSYSTSQLYSSSAFCRILTPIAVADPRSPTEPSLIISRSLPPALIRKQFTPKGDLEANRRATLCAYG